MNLWTLRKISCWLGLTRIDVKFNLRVFSKSLRLDKSAILSRIFWGGNLNWSLIILNNLMSNTISKSLLNLSARLQCILNHRGIYTDILFTLCYFWLSHKIIVGCESRGYICVFLTSLFLNDSRGSLTLNLNFTWLKIDWWLRPLIGLLALNDIDNWLVILRSVECELLISLLKSF